MKAKTEKVMCLTPTPGKQGTRIDRWKYETLRRALRRVIPRNKSGIEFRHLPDLVAASLTAAELQKMGSIMWYVVTVKQHLEAIGEIERVPNAKPLRLRRVS